MRVHCLLLSVVSGERKGVQLLTENSIAHKTGLLGGWMWLDWKIETNNQTIPQTFILINFCGAGCIKKSWTWVDFIIEAKKKKRFNLPFKILLVVVV